MTFLITTVHYDINICAVLFTTYYLNNKDRNKMPIYISYFNYLIKCANSY